MSPAPTHHLAKCLAKTRRDQVGAEREAKRLRGIDPGSKAYAYQCCYCMFWHVSCNIADPKSAKKNARSREKRAHEEKTRKWEERLQ